MDDTNRQWRLRSRPHGPFEESDVEMVEEPRPTPGDGEALVQVRYLSMDPTIRGWMEYDTYLPRIPIGDVVRGAGLGEIVESNVDAYRVGTLVYGYTGWQEYTLADTADRGMIPLPDGTDPEQAVALFGPSGLAAYFGMLDVGQPEEGDTVLVSGAAGATGSVAGQIAKMRGAHVVGTAGSDEKCSFLTDRLGFDGAINYRTEDVPARLRELCPDGINVFFDNVGGDILDAALARLAIGARIALCGGISNYDRQGRQGPKNYMQLVTRRARMQGFLVLDYADRWQQAMADLGRWAAEGAILQVVDVMDGFETTPAAFKRLFTGGNLGKNLVKVS